MNPPSRRHWVIIICFVWSALAGCNRDAQVFFPLAVGNQWVYLNQANSGYRALIAEVFDPQVSSLEGYQLWEAEEIVEEADGVFISLTKQTIKDLSTGKELDLGPGIRAGYRVLNGIQTGPIDRDTRSLRESVFLIKEPVRKGTRWGHFAITADDLSIETPAGRFEGCLQVRWAYEAGGGANDCTYVFAPKVGLVAMRQWDRRTHTEILLTDKVLQSFSLKE